MCVHVHQVPVTRNQVGELPGIRYRPCLVSTISSWTRTVDESRMDPQERAKIGEGDLWKHAGQNERHEVGEVDAFTQMVSESSQTLVALCQEGSVHLQT